MKNEEAIAWMRKLVPHIPEGKVMPSDEAPQRIERNTFLLALFQAVIGNRQGAIRVLYAARLRPSLAGGDEPGALNVSVKPAPQSHR